MFVQNFKEFEIYTNFLESDENGRKIDMYKFENYSITGRNLFYPNCLLKNKDNLVIPLLERTMSLKDIDPYKNLDNLVNVDTENIESIPCFFFVYNTGNYFHFLYDTLPYLITYFKLKEKIPNLKLLMQYPKPNFENHYKFVLEFLEILSIFEKDILLINSKTNYKELYISTSYTHDLDSNLPPRKEIFEFYQNIVKKVKEKYSIDNTPKKIYISRRTHLHNDFSNIGTNYTTRRRMVNEDDLVEKLLKEGYQEVFTEKLTTWEKILYFHQADNIVGSIGGGIANVVFCKKSAKLEAIISPGFLDVNNRFKYCLNWVDVNYNFNTCHVEKGEFKKYIRVEYRDMVGEIEDYDEEYIKIQVTEGDNVGWDFDSKYTILEVKKEEVERLDEGLNSIFFANILKNYS